MSNILVFMPKKTLSCEQNYRDFIAFAKNKLTLFDEFEFNGNRGWECDKWSWQTSSGGRESVVFGVSHNAVQCTPFRQPYADFAKAYVRYQMSLSWKNSSSWASSLVWLYKAIAEQTKMGSKPTFDILKIDNNTINHVERLIEESGLTAQTKHSIASSMLRVIEFIKDMRFKLDLPDWSIPFRRNEKMEIKPNVDGQSEVSNKCPTDYQMLQVAEAFRLAKTTRQKYFTSLCVMLMCQPSRSVELNGLTTNSLQKTDKGRWYLMWHPAKGGMPVRKWIPKLLENAVQEAFQRLVDISAPARKAAKFAYHNPDKFMVHEKCTTPEEFPHDKQLNYKQFANAMGLKAGINGKGQQISWNTHYNTKWLNDLIDRLNGTSDWKQEIPFRFVINNNNTIMRVMSANCARGKSWYQTADITFKFPSYSDCVDIVHQQYKRTHFPFLGGIPLWECISLVRDNEFHAEFMVKPFSWVPLKHHALRNAINAETKNGGLTIFEELGITDEDSFPMVLTSHQFRHWLNTKLMQAGEEDWLIAKWSGRADTKQNRIYDGRTPEQKSRLTKRIGSIVSKDNALTVAKVNQELAGYTSEAEPHPLLLHDLGLPISLKALGVKRSGVAQFTGLGYCIHDYSESPCIKSGDCLTCSEHVCLKGMPQTLDELKNFEKLYREQLARAVESAEKEVFGADRWVTSIGFKLSKIKAILAMLQSPCTAEDLQVRVPDELDPSPVKRSLGASDTRFIPPLDLTDLALKNLS